MSQTVITQAFEALKAQEAANSGVLTLDEFVFASVPNLNITDPIDRNEGLPPASQIVHRQAVSRTGMVNSNAVVYSVVLGADVGDFEFNWVGLLNKASGVVAMIVHAPSQKKIHTQSGQQGNVLTRSFLMEYNGASQQTQIITPADTWQIDFTARLNGVDERIRLENIDGYGHASFLNEGFEVSGADGGYLVKRGVAYIEGLRAELLFDQAVTVATRPSRIWVDVCWRGTLTSVWATATKITVADTLANYVTGDEQHYVCAIADILTDGTVVDLRQANGMAQLVGLTAEPNTVPYFDKKSRLKKTALSEFIRSLLAVPDAAGVLSGLGLNDPDYGVALIAAQQPFPGSVPRTQRDKNLENISPADFGAKGDEETNDTAAFLALENAVNNRIVDLGGRVYLVDKDFNKNKYINGYFRAVNKLLNDAEFPEGRLQTRKKGITSGFRPSTPNHVKSGLRLATIRDTTIQGAVLDYYDNILYTLQNVSGSAANNDEVNKIVAYNWFGQDTLTPLWETQGSSDIGHQSLGLTIGRIGYRNTRGQLQLWGLAGVSKGDQRAQYITRFTPTDGGAIAPEFFRIWDETYLNHVNVLCTDPTSTWLITTAKRYVGPGESADAPDQLRYYVKVYHTDVFTDPAVHGYDYCNAATFEFEIADFVRDMQAVACDGTTIYFCQAGSAYSTTRKYLHMYTLDGVYLGVQQIQAGAGRAYEIADPGNTGTPDPAKLTYEPEAMFFRMIVGGYDLVMGNTNGIPDGDIGRETSFYTLMPQQALHIKTTSRLQPGIVLDATADIVTNSGLMSLGKIDSDGVKTEQAYLNDSGFTVARTTETAARFDAKNTVRHVTFHVSGAGDAGIFDYTNNKWVFKSPTPLTNLIYLGQPLEVDGPIRSYVDNVNSCGTATRKFTQVHATNGTINTSDATHKSKPLTPEQLAQYLQAAHDAILDAWGEVSIIAFQWLSDIQAKGEDKARWHFGAIAQQVRDAFLAHGIDGTRFGLLCYDEWEDEYRPVMGLRDVVTQYETPEGEIISRTSREEYDTGEVELVMAAGNRWGLRPDECLWLEAAYQRRKMERFEARLTALELLQ